MGLQWHNALATSDPEAFPERSIKPRKKKKHMTKSMGTRRYQREREYRHEKGILILPLRCTSDLNIATTATRARSGAEENKWGDKLGAQHRYNHRFFPWHLFSAGSKKRRMGDRGERLHPGNENASLFSRKFSRSPNRCFVLEIHERGTLDSRMCVSLHEEDVGRRMGGSWYRDTKEKIRWMA